jgi:formate dehydrogenase iron-sulfur subunit
MANEKAILVDETKCTACRACQVACKQWNQNRAVKTTNRGSYENPPTLGSETWMRILFNEQYEENRMQWLFTKHQCMHCTEAACVEVCPPQATNYIDYELKDGGTLHTVQTDPDKCIGCNYCRVACPFDVPGYGQKEKGIFRCTLCFDRVANDVSKYNVPACVKSCAPGTLSFGDRDELIAQAEERVAELKAAGYRNARVYGKDELGGLMYIYVLTEEPEAYQLPNDPSIPIGTKAWKALTKPWGAFAAGGIVLALIVNGVINARNRGLEEKYKLEE